MQSLMSRSAKSWGNLQSSAIPTGLLNCSYNILLVYRLNKMRHMENLNFALAIACLGYW